MNTREAAFFLFTIAKEIKGSLDHPVILLTLKDYADLIFNNLVQMRTIMLQHRPEPESIMDIITNFHLEWLDAVKDIESFKNNMKNVPRETIYKAVDFTMESVLNRRKYFQRYIDQLQTNMTFEDCQIIQRDQEIIEDMHNSLNSVLQDKLNSLRSLADQPEYYLKVADETEELMNWLDTLNNNLTVQFSKVVEFKCPKLITNLAQILYQIVDEISKSTDPEAQMILRQMNVHKSCVIQLSPAEEFEIRKIVEKIKVLESRTERCQSESPSAVMALQHKALYYEEQLCTLENLKTALYTLRNKRISDLDLNKPQELRIFDHLLPPIERCRLVEQLTGLWHDAICGIEKEKSLISILSAADIKEVFSDEMGKFTVDKHGRKLYKSQHDEYLYQINHENKLVAVKDDEKHVYFYDDCGRYYLNENKQRIYKAHANASEYLINREGILLKFKETILGVEYVYDCLGRFCVNEDGRKIYTENGNSDTYEHDGLGNLVRTQSKEVLYKICAPDPIITEESKYLQRTVGNALKRCLADVVLHQPLDPILYLANSLEKYRHSMAEKQKRQRSELEMMAERERRMPVHKSPDSSYISVESQSTKDYNLINYETVAPKDF